MLIFKQIKWCYLLLLILQRQRHHLRMRHNLPGGNQILQQHFMQHCRPLFFPHLFLRHKTFLLRLPRHHHQIFRQTLWRNEQIVSVIIITVSNICFFLLFIVKDRLRKYYSTEKQNRRTKKSTEMKETHISVCSSFFSFFKSQINKC